MQSQSSDQPTSSALKKAWQQLHQVAPKGILSSQKMTRRQRERLTTAGYLEPIMRGWYRLKAPGGQNTSTAPILDFLPVYLEERLGTRWCLSAESSLVIRANAHTDPGRLVVMAEVGSTTVHTFDSGLRLTIYQDDQQLPTRMETINGFRVMALDTALGRMTNAQWSRQTEVINQTLSGIKNFETMVWQWLSEERYQATMRLGLRLGELGLTKAHNFVKKSLQEEGLTLPEKFREAPSTVQSEINTNTDDLKTVWNIWSERLQSNYTPAPQPDQTLLTRLASIEHALGDDAHNHLALSGFQVPREAIMNILAAPELAADASGWPHLSDHERLTVPGQSSPLPGDIDPQALVSMQGYLEALRLVKRSIVRMLEGQDLQRTLRQDLRGWRLALMSPSAEAGLITRRQVLRYRETEPSETDIRKSMDTWIELVAGSQPGVERSLLGFLGIMQLKPWSHGNQRLAFLLYNGLNAAAGHPWTVLKATEDTRYKEALSQALVEGNPVGLANLMAAYQI